MLAPKNASTARSQLTSLPFAGFLSELARETASERVAERLRLGLVTMRLMDAWFAGAGAADWGVKAIEERLAQWQHGYQARTLLEQLLGVAREPKSREASRRAIVAMWQYGRFLEFQGFWLAATDVFHNIIRNSSRPAYRLRVRSYLRIGHALRWAGDIDGARAAYVSARQEAREVGDWEGLLRCRVGVAQIAEHVGNYPRAERVLDSVIRGARQRRLTSVLARALHQRSALAFWREQYEIAAVFGVRALRLTKNENERHRVLGDVATALMRLGQYDTARNTFATIAARANQHLIRAGAMVNLLDVEIAVGNWTEARRYERLLSGSALPPFIRIMHQRVLGLLASRQGQKGLACVHFTEMLALATEFRLNRLILEAERYLAGHVPEPQQSPPPSESLSELTQEVELASRALLI